jgi:hypothetical protein
MIARTIGILTLGWLTAGSLVGCAKRDDTGARPTGGDSTSVAATSGGDSTRMASGSPTFSGPDTLWNDGKPLGQPVAKFGSDMPAWTGTTVGAANRGLTGRPVTVVGEVVDVSCYLQLGKRGEKHIPCGTDCIKNGAPIGVVDAKNVLYMVMAEEHDPRRYGNIALKEAMLPFLAKTVQVTGMVTERDGVRTLYVQGYTLGTDPNQPRGQ